MSDKTTCGSHRVVGYYIAGGKWLCRGCGEPEERHETNAETIARKYRERQAESALAEGKFGDE